jgi:hypothetical protein
MVGTTPEFRAEITKIMKKRGRDRATQYGFRQ